jgi:hypothetical protein
MPVLLMRSPKPARCVHGVGPAVLQRGLPVERRSMPYAPRRSAKQWSTAKLHSMPTTCRDRPPPAAAAVGIEAARVQWAASDKRWAEARIAVCAMVLHKQHTRSVHAVQISKCAKPLFMVHALYRSIHASCSCPCWPDCGRQSLRHTFR